MVIIKNETNVTDKGESIYHNIEYRVFADDDINGVQEYLNRCLGQVTIQKV